MDIEEIWKDIPNYEGLYQVSNLGRIKSLKRYKQNHSKLQLVEEKILKQYVNKRNGYCYVMLCNNVKEKTCRVHKLVAITFLNNNNNYNTIDHIDGNKQNNCVTNLEWVTQKENIIRALKNGLKNNNNQKIKITQLSKDMKIIKQFDSILQASKILKLNPSNIVSCLKGKQKTCGGYIFKYGWLE